MQSIALAMSTATMHYEAVPQAGAKEVTGAKAATNAARQIFQQLAALLEETKGLPGPGPVPGEVVKEASPAEVTGLLQSVKRVCGGAARGLSKQLGPITAALNSGASIRVRHPFPLPPGQILRLTMVLLTLKEPIDKLPEVLFNQKGPIQIYPSRNASTRSHACIAQMRY